MARDYLTIQGSATPSKLSFSNASLTDSKQHNRLAPDTFEALQLLKSAYRSGHLSASVKAENYYQTIMSGLRGEDLNADADGSATLFFSLTCISIYSLSCIYCASLRSE
jgi:hypothetical protein